MSQTNSSENDAGSSNPIPDDDRQMRDDTLDSALADELFIASYRSRMSGVAPSSLPLAAIEAHAQLAASRPKGTARVQAHVPKGARYTQLQVVAEDMPWLVASLRTILETRGHTLSRLIHPLIPVRRKASGEFDEVAEDGSGAALESFMHAELEVLDEKGCDTLAHAVMGMLDTLKIVRDCSDAHSARLLAHADHVADPEQAAFLRWLDSRQFVPFGAARVSLDATGHIETLEQQTGLLSPDAGRAAWVSDDFLPARLDADRFDTDISVFICKAGRESPLIRREHADLVMYAERDQAGTLVSLDCIVGLFVPGLQAEAISAVPWLRDRISRVMQSADLDENTHAGKSMLASLRSLPREMLLHNRTSRLVEIAQGIAALAHSPRSCIFTSVDPLGRYWNCLVFLPSDVYSRDLRLGIERHLENGLDGYATSFESTFSSSSALARIHFVVRRRKISTQAPDWSTIEATIAAATVSWNDRFVTALAERVSGVDVSRHNMVYGEAFPLDYRERYPIEDAVEDALLVSATLGTEIPIMSPLSPGVTSDLLTFRIHSEGKRMPLFEAIPLIENLGFSIDSEHPFEIRRRGQENVHSHVFTVRTKTPSGSETRAPDAAASKRVSEAFNAIWTGAAENDGFNRLVFAAGLDWQQVNVLRTLGKYAVQTRATFSLEYMIDALIGNAHIARLLVRLFEERLSPLEENPGSDARATQLEVDNALDNVASLDEDRILRRFKDTILAVLRTNHWCQNDKGQARDYLSLKLDCARVPDLPLPRPAFEIFVSSATVDGVHLRGGSVARGGLRWSDRKEDYRTEVLGLMKAQQVKNAVIVPVGSKGGFYVKSDLPEDRAAATEVVLEAYRRFLSGLLDITDNLDGTTVQPPANVVRRDGDDPYLVVAADKGTATFSDHANAVAESYEFWLGDGFASGGSVGYDHKKMGITARGAWESVKRHFRGLGIDTQTQAFTAVGVGDMSGDVFGNGMLLSRHIRLVAAFDHRHVFIDPTPSTLEAHAERERLFNLPRSSWDDYDRGLISEGGGIWARTEKSIPLSEQARVALGTDATSMTPDQLVSAILAAPVDLLWNGGIGTYVKSSQETHMDAADRANDAVRINARDLRCQIVGEGGNLGFTQNGRIEFSKRGGLMYTDAIDNSAGVDCSDHEVNIKILLNAAIDSGRLSRDDRDALLESMTDEVGDLVLMDNYRQTDCIDAHHALGLAAMDDQSAVLDTFEATGRLDRSIEFLPDNDTLIERFTDQVPLTRPEIAVLVSYAKMSLYDEVMASDLPDRPALSTHLIQYFPVALRERFSEDVKAHRLAREIIATVVTNDVINRLGPVWIERRKAEFGVNGAAVVDAYLAVREIFELDTLVNDVDALDNKIDNDTQALLAHLVTGLAERGTHWVLRSLRDSSPTDDQIATWKRGVNDLITAMPECLSAAPAETYRQRVAHFEAADVPESTATRIAGVVPLSSALDIVEIARTSQQSISTVASLYFELGEFLDLHWLRDAIAELDVDSRLHARARTELRSDLHYQHRHLAADIVALQPEGKAAERIDRWQTDLKARVTRYRNLLEDIRNRAEIEYVTLSLAINELHKLMRAR